MLQSLSVNKLQRFLQTNILQLYEGTAAILINPNLPQSCLK